MYYSHEEVLNNPTRMSQIERIFALIEDGFYDEAVEMGVDINLEKGEMDSFLEVSPDIEDYIDMNAESIEQFEEDVEDSMSMVGKYKKEKFEISATFEEAKMKNKEKAIPSILDEMSVEEKQNQSNNITV